MLKVFVFIIAISCIFETNGDDFINESISKALKALEISNNAFTNASESIANSAKPGEIFSKLGSALVELGPAAIAISAVISSISIQSPENGSQELELIKNNFLVVDNKINIFTSTIPNLDSINELKIVRAAHTIIKNNFETLVEAVKNPTKENFKLFAEQYKRTFDFSTTNLYNFISGSTGPLKFETVNLIKTRVKCNPIVLSQLCTLGMHFIIKGLAVEGAYLGYRYFTESAQAKAETWKEKLNDVSKQCSEVIDSCEKIWKDYAIQQFSDSHKTMSGSNEEIANKIAKDLNSVVPQRNWLVVVYGAASGWGPHTYDTYYHVESKWRQNKHDVTIFSIEKNETLTGDAYNELVQLIETQKAISAKVSDCRQTVFWLIKKDRYTEHARVIVSKIREKYTAGVVYAIQLNFKPAVAITGGTLYVSEQKWQCSSPNFKLIIYQ